MLVLCNLHELVSCMHVTVHLCVSYTCAVATYLSAAYMCQLTSSGHFGFYFQVICVVGQDTCVVYMWNSHGDPRRLAR